MTILHKKVIVDASKMNAGPLKSYKLTKELVGGYENIGVTKNDFKNFTRDLKVFIGDTDAHMFVNTFKKKSETWSGFYFKYDTDEFGTLRRIFWADPLCRKNYSLYGDMVSFDTTYDTNKYSLVFTPFTGVNNHRKCVTFGVGFIANEDHLSFQWLFEAFLEAMGGNEPVCLITDQDPAMKIAISTCFSKTQHRLCMWHIMKKLKDKVSEATFKHPQFLKKLNEVVWNRDMEVSDFEVGWKEVIEEFELQDNDWFTWLYVNKKFWIPTFFRELFLGAILRSTQISECENNFFCNFINSSVTLVEFNMRYDSAMDAQRHLQLELDTATNHSIPQIKTPNSLEKHASKVYTHSIFYRFQSELECASFSCGTKSYTSSGGEENCVVDDHIRGKSFQVKYVPDTQECSCSCKMFESEGILCRHILFVLRSQNMTLIPDRYILNRWTKDAPRKPVFDISGNLLKDSEVFANQKNVLSSLWSKIFNCVFLAEKQDEGLSFLLQKVELLEMEMIQRRNVTSAADTVNEFESFLNCTAPKEGEILIKPPNKCNNKGRRRRIQSEKEKAIEASKHKNLRNCKGCGGKVRHDLRNCPVQIAKQEALKKSTVCEESAGSDADNSPTENTRNKRRRSTRIRNSR